MGLSVAFLDIIGAWSRIFGLLWLNVCVYFLDALVVFSSWSLRSHRVLFRLSLLKLHSWRGISTQESAVQ